MNSLTFALMLTIITSPAFAQSGGTNGDPDTDVLQYTQKLDPTTVNEQSLSEAIAALKKALQSIADQNIPQYPGAGDAFWQEITEKDKETMTTYDAAIEEAIQQSISIIDSIPRKLATYKSIRKSLENDWTLYDQEDMNSLWRQNRRDLRREDRRAAKTLVSKAVNTLFDPFLGTGSNRNFATWSCYSGFNFGLKPLTFYFQKCESLPCLNAIQSKAKQYLGTIEALEDFEFSIPGIMEPTPLKKALVVKRESGGIGWKNLYRKSMRKSTQVIESKNEVLLQLNMKKITQHSNQ